jgi:UDPglucose 6-dehydrogenase
VLGGDRPDTIAVADLYKTIWGAELAIHQTDSTTAELTKYMDNSFLALKVTFCNELYDVAQLFGVDYNELRELWLMDPRVGRSHTLVQPDNRGFGGKCLPKDVSALVSSARKAGYLPRLLSAVLDANARFRGLLPPPPLAEVSNLVPPHPGEVKVGAPNGHVDHAERDTTSVAIPSS